MTESADAGSIDAAVEELLALVRPLATAFTNAGHSLYLVGGIVRDQLLGVPFRSIDDVDLTTDARPPTIKKLVGPFADAVWTQGERFGTIGLRSGSVDYEITTFRAEVYRDDSRKPQVAFADVVEADLARRDFTINAMARILPDGGLVDPHGGLADLEAGILRTPLDPLVSFGDDPLRMLRAARFVARLGVTPEPAMVAAITTMVDRLDIVSTERIRDELLKLLRTDDPSTGIALLLDTGLVEKCLPELATVSLEQLRDLRAVHTDLALIRLALVWLGMAGDDVQAAGRAVRLSNEQANTVRTLVEGVTMATVAAAEGFSPASVRRVAHRTVGSFGDTVEVFSAGDPTGARTLRAAADALEAAGEDLTDWSPPLGGDEIMALLGIEPGPAIGEATTALRELRFVEGPISADRARRFLQP